MDLREKSGALEPTSIDIIFQQNVGVSCVIGMPQRSVKPQNKLITTTFLTLPNWFFRLVCGNCLEEDKIQ